MPDTGTVSQLEGKIPRGIVEPRTIHLEPTARAQRAALVSHLVPAATLLMTGVGELLDPQNSDVLVPALCSAGGAAVLILIVREFRKAGAKEEEAINLLEVAAGVMLFLEAMQMRHPGKVFQPAIGYAAAGIITIGRAALYRRFPRRRDLSVNGEGFSLRTMRFKKMHARWTEIKSFKRIGVKLIVELKSGGVKTFSLRRVKNYEEAFSVLRAAAITSGVVDTIYDI